MKDNGKGGFTYTPGHETFPDNWYKRAADDPYGITFFTIDSAAFALYAPEFFSIGGNTGKTNTFTGLDPGDITGGVTSIGDLSDPKKLACYMFQLGVQSTPDFLEVSTNSLLLFAMFLVLFRQTFFSTRLE